MKSPLNLALYILFLIIVAYNSNLSAQDDGWIDKGSYKLINTKYPTYYMSLSADQKVIYVLDAKYIIRYIDYETGKQIDSFQIEGVEPSFGIDYFSFSPDGHTCIYSLKNKTWHTHSSISIIELQSKKLINDKQDLIRFNEYFSSAFREEKEDFYVSTNTLFMNYIYSDSLLYINVAKHDNYFDNAFHETWGYFNGFFGSLRLKEDGYFYNQRTFTQSYAVESYDIQDSFFIFTKAYYRFYSKSGTSYHDEEYMTEIQSQKTKIKMDYISLFRSTNIENIMLFFYPNTVKYYDVKNHLFTNTEIPLPYSASQSHIYVNTNREKDLLTIYRDSVFHFYKIKGAKKLDSIVRPLPMNHNYIVGADNNIVAETDKNEIILLKTGNLSSIDFQDEVQSELKLYPNPAYDKMNIGLSDKPISNVEILDLYGNVVLKLNQEQLASSNPNFDISTLPIGVYFVRVQYEHQILTQNFIKLR